MRLATISLFAAAAFFAVGSARAQTPTPAPTPETLAAARELVQVINATNQFKALLPTLFQAFKPAIVQNRPEVEKQYDAMLPMFYQKAEQRLDELTAILAGVYARNFTVDELHDITAFYRSATGQKFVQHQQAIAQQSLAAGQQFGREVADDVKQQMGDHAN